MERNEFLDRVRTAASRGNAHRVHVRELPANAGYVGAGVPDLVAAMAGEVRGAGGEAHVADDAEAARGVLVELLRQYRPRTALAWQHPALKAAGLDDLLSSRGIALFDHAALAGSEPAEQRMHALAADIGFTGADWAIAETGTLVVCSRPGQERMASLLPPVHVAVVEESRILPDLFDLVAALQGNAAGPELKLPSNVTLITGPSKTGDIELELTTGVHGPGKWHVVMVRGKARTQ
jgi:L-lactate dehydrogenase complex protein LldG